MQIWSKQYEIGGKYKLSRRAFFDCEKYIPNKMHPSSNYSPTNTPSPTPTHEIIGGLYNTNPPDDTNDVLKKVLKCKV